MTDEQIEYYRKKINEFMNIYGDNYPIDAKEYILNHAFDINFDKKIFVDIMSQVYQSVGVFDIVHGSTYEVYLNYLQENYDINQDLLEVGCGFFPSFAQKLSKYQKCGSITVIDPVVVVNNLDKIKIIKSRFSQNMDVTKYELIYGLYPCEATIDMIKCANKQDKDLCIELCGCTHFENDSSYVLPYVDWLNYVESVLESTIPDNREYEIDEIDDLSYPIIKTFKK